jgi:uncharacterized protein YqgC (DUF456 family)
MFDLIYVYLVLLLILNACWLGLVFFYLPGNWLMVLTTAGFAWWQWERGLFSPWTLGAVAVLALAGEIVEFFAGFGGAKKAGAGLWASLAAIGGALVGAFAGTFLIPIPFLGTLLGGCIGAGLGTWAVERLCGRHPDQSLRSGVGAGAGALIGTLVKVMIGVLIWIVIAAAAFWP